MKYKMMLLLCVVLALTGTFFWIGNASQEQEIAGESAVTQGYTKPIIIPEKKLSDEEKRTLQVVSKMNQILTEEKDVESIMNRLTPVCSEMWNEDFDHAGIHLEFRAAPSPKKPIINIFITTAKNKDAIRFFVSGPNSLKENREKVVEMIEVFSPGIEPQTSTKYSGVNYIFHGSGHLGMISYYDENSAQVGVVKKWDENGKFLGVDVLYFTSSMIWHFSGFGIQGS